MSKTCELCSRELSDSYNGSVCPVCKQDFEARKAIDQESQQNPNSNNSQTSNLNQQAANWRQPPFNQNMYNTSNPAKSNQTSPYNSSITYQDQIELDKLAGLETTSAVVWLIIGILQVLSLVLILVGAWNIYVSTTRFKRVTFIKNGEPWIPNVVDKELGSIILFAIINFVLGAIIGVISPLIDLYIRDVIIKKRYLFERNSPQIY